MAVGLATRACVVSLIRCRICYVSHSFIVVVASHRSRFSASTPLLVYCSATMPMPPKSVDAAFLASAKKKDARGAKELSDDELEKLVRRKRFDNLKGLSPKEYTITVDKDGYTCHKRLTERAQLNHANPKLYPLVHVSGPS